MLIQSRQSIKYLTIALLMVAFLFSCKKDPGNQNTPQENLPDLSTTIISSVSGFVSGENNAAISGATVKVGNLTTSTDKYGFFELRNVEVIKAAAVVTVLKPGYFKGIKTYIANDGKSAFFRIKLIPKVLSGTIDASVGGNVTLQSGLIISLPPNAVVNTLNNIAYTGLINVAASYLDPTLDEQEAMPSDFRGIDKDGLFKGIVPYGVAAIELTNASGESLQIASGKKALLTIPIPGSALSSAPSSIPLWYVDENAGLWMEQGSASKTGNAYVGEVSHFTYWEGGFPNAIVPLTFNIADPAGNPLINANVQILQLNSWWHINGSIDSSGYASLFVTPNTQYSLSVYADCDNGLPIDTQSFTVGTTNVDLGTITVINTQFSNISGTVTDCNGNPVSNGNIIMQKNNRYYKRSLSNAGTYSFTSMLCGSDNCFFIAEDNTTMQQGIVFPYILTSGQNTIGNLQACGISASEFLIYSINGTNYSYTYPLDSLFYFNYPGSSYASVSGREIGNGSNGVRCDFNNSGLSVNSTQDLMSFEASHLPLSNIPNPIPVNITEYGAIGEFISGNFAGVLSDQVPPYTPYNVTCTFRVRRIY